MSLTLRQEVIQRDRRAISDIVGSTDFFNRDERAIAIELVDAYLEKGDQSGYRFVFAQLSARETRPVAFACYGFIAGTQASFDLYWIAVHNDYRGKGIGKTLLETVARAARAAGGVNLYAETSSRASYQSTRQFYLSNGFEQQASLAGFYAPGDDKLIYCLKLQSTIT